MIRPIVFATGLFLATAAHAQKQQITATAHLIRCGHPIARAYAYQTEKGVAEIYRRCARQINNVLNDKKWIDICASGAYRGLCVVGDPAKVRALITGMVNGGAR